jgi:hypothetical protein
MKKLLIFLVIVMAFFVSCADKNDYADMLEKKGYKVLYIGSYDVIVQKDDYIGAVYVDTNNFRKTVEKDTFKEYVHWFEFLKVREIPETGM